MHRVSFVYVYKLSAKTVQRTALSLERVYDVHSGDSLALCVLAVGDLIADNVLEKDLWKSVRITKCTLSKSVPSTRHVSLRR